jgi:plasmid stability protein
MKAITVRNLPPPVAKAIQHKAKRENKSLNQTVVALLEMATGQAGAKSHQTTLHRDLDHLAGSWTEAEADEFDAYLKESRSIINPKDWE